jgi:hypothetical protein
MGMFRVQIGRLVDRTQRIGRDGLHTIGQQPSGEAKARPLSADELLDRKFADKLLLKAEEHYLRQLEDIPGSQERERALLRFLADTSWSWAFEKVYSAIYGSQIIALEFLNENRVGVPTDALRVIHREAVEKYGKSHPSTDFNSWLRFLQNIGLTGLNAAGDVTISDIGRAFLGYLVQQGYPKDGRPG